MPRICVERGDGTLVTGECDVVEADRNEIMRYCSAFDDTRSSGPLRRASRRARFATACMILSSNASPRTALGSLSDVIRGDPGAGERFEVWPVF